MARLAAALFRLDRALTRADRASAALAVLLVLAISAAGAIARSLNAPLVWADEAAIAAMTWAAFLGASALIGQRGHMAITLLPDRLPPRAAALVTLLADALVLAFMLSLAALVWRWFDLPGLIRAGSPDAFARTSFNFLYTEPTQTLPFGKLWLWLVLPLFCATGTIHAAAQLARSAQAFRRTLLPQGTPA